MHLVVAPWQRAMVDDGSLDPDPRLTIHIGEMEPSSLSRNVWYYRELPALAARLRADVVAAADRAQRFPVDVAAFDRFALLAKVGSAFRQKNGTGVDRNA